MILFDEKGQRVPMTGSISRHGFPSYLHGWVAREWRPGFAAIRLARGWRIVPLGVGKVNGQLDHQAVLDWWEPATPDQKRMPTIAAVEMYLRTVYA